MSHRHDAARLNQGASTASRDQERETERLAEIVRQRCTILLHGRSSGWQEQNQLRARGLRRQLSSIVDEDDRQLRHQMQDQEQQHSSEPHGRGNGYAFGHGLQGDLNSTPLRTIAGGIAGAATSGAAGGVGSSRINGHDHATADVFGLVRAFVQHSFAPQTLASALCRRNRRAIVMAVGLSLIHI